MLRACQTASRLNADMRARQRGDRRTRYIRDPVKQIQIELAALDVQIHYPQKARRKASAVAVGVHTPNKTVTVHLPTEADQLDVHTLAERVCAEHCTGPELLDLCLTTVAEELLDHGARLTEQRVVRRPPKTMPPEMMDDYTDGGTIPVRQWWSDGTLAQKPSDPWPVPLIDALMYLVSIRHHFSNALSLVT